METRIDKINTVWDRMRLGQRTTWWVILIAFGFLLCYFLNEQGYIQTDAISSTSASGNIQVCPPSPIQVVLHYEIPNALPAELMQTGVR